MIFLGLDSVNLTGAYTVTCDSIMKVLYNNCYGAGFSLSDAFVTEYEKRSGKPLDPVKALFHTGADSIRCDPIAVALFEEMGSAWCSGPDSELAIREVPDVLSRYWEIEEGDGDEYVRVCIADALADILHTFMQTNNRADLDRQYAAIMDASVLKTEPTT
jgi:hypothetical protein